MKREERGRYNQIITSLGFSFAFDLNNLMIAVSTQNKKCKISPNTNQAINENQNEIFVKKEVMAAITIVPIISFNANPNIRCE